MNAAPHVKGWCPGALRPMMSGDGLVVRVRPYAGRLNQQQTKGLAKLATAHGNGMIDLTARGNVQLRGVRADSHTPLIEELRELSLVDVRAEVENRRNILVTPFWQDADDAQQIAAELADALAQNDAPNLPSKFGFAIDTGAQPMLQTASADIRLERDVTGSLILVADGSDVGKPVSAEGAVTQMMALARWFMARRDAQTRMGALVRVTALPDAFTIPRQLLSFHPKPCLTPQGMLCAVALGQMQADTLEALAELGSLRMTPWRMVLIEGVSVAPAIDGLITNPDDPVLRVIACTGAPRCAQALAQTKPLARQLAPYVPKDMSLHVSGCAKGCAHPRPAALTVTAVAGGHALIHNGTAGDADPNATLTPDDLIQNLKAI